MSDYEQITSFTAKDNLETGHEDKLLVGALIDAELAAIAVAIATKAEGAATLCEVSTGSFTPTWTGFSTDPSGDMAYQTIGDGTHSYVILGDDTGAAMTGASNANTMTITGIPTAIRPDATVWSAFFPGNDGSQNELGASITAAGVITFYVVGSNGALSSTGFATGGSDGGLRAGAQIIYPLVVTS